VSVAGHRAGFVCLQLTDKMPGEIEITAFGCFRRRLLVAVLADVADTQFREKTHVRGRILFGHRDDGDLLGLASCRRAGGSDPLADPFQVRGELCASCLPAHGTLQTYPANRPVVASLR